MSKFEPIKKYPLDSGITIRIQGIFYHSPQHRNGWHAIGHCMLKRLARLKSAAPLLCTIDVILHCQSAGFDVFVLEGFKDVAVFFENGLKIIVFINRFSTLVLEKALVRGQQFAKHSVMGRFVNDLMKSGVDGQHLVDIIRRV